MTNKKNDLIHKINNEVYTILLVTDQLVNMKPECNATKKVQGHIRQACKPSQRIHERTCKNLILAN